MNSKFKTKQELELALEEIKREYGEWVFDIPLPFGVWTRGNLKRPNTRLKRIVQVVKDLAGKPLSECRILDLGCLDGMYSVEFALQGAETVGVEIREANVKKAIFCKEALGLENLGFRHDDVRNISLASYGEFDAIVCSGVLYHLPAADAIDLIDRMHGIANRLVVLDTHVALERETKFLAGRDEYWGSVYREHSESATAEQKAGNPLASADNPTSFWFTRPSLLNIISRAGFSSVYECFVPIHLNFGRAGTEHRDRCTFVAIKDDVCSISTSPSVNDLMESWPEKSLSYAPLTPHMKLLKKVISKLKTMAGR